MRCSLCKLGAHVRCPDLPMLTRAASLQLHQSIMLPQGSSAYAGPGIPPWLAAQAQYVQLAGSSPAGPSWQQESSIPKTAQCVQGALSNSCAPVLRKPYPDHMPGSDRAAEWTPVISMLTQPARLAGTKLLVSASNSVHYLYNVAAPHAGPQACFTGHTTDSFYIKTAFSPDGDHVLSGSSDGHACIWPVRATAFAWRRVQASDGGLVLCLVSALGDFEKHEESGRHSRSSLLQAALLGSEGQHAQCTKLQVCGRHQGVAHGTCTLICEHGRSIDTRAGHKSTRSMLQWRQLYTACALPAALRSSSSSVSPTHRVAAHRQHHRPKPMLTVPAKSPGSAA